MNSQEVREPAVALLPQDLPPPQDWPPPVSVRSQGALRAAPQRSESGPSGSAAGTPPGSHLDQYNDQEHEQEQDQDDDEGNESDANHRGPRKDRPRKPHLQGRFSGRLETKSDEKRLADECRMLGPMLGGIGKRGEKSRLTLAKIVRGIASGQVRKFCEAREQKIQELTAQLERLEAAGLVPGKGPLARQDPVKQEQERNFLGMSTSQAALAVAPLAPALGNTALPQAPKAILVQDGTAPMHLAQQHPVSSSMDISTSAAQVVSGAPVAQTALVSQNSGQATPVSPSEAQALAQGAVQLKAQAQNFQAHAEQLAVQSQQATSEPEMVQVAVQAQSFQAKAQSLEKAAEAQTLQAQAVVHAQAQAQAQAQAHHLVAQAHDHAQAYAQAAAQADHLKKVSSMGAVEVQQAHQVVVAQAHQFEAEAHNHAQAQTHLTVQAHNLAAKAQAHAHAQAQAQAQAQAAAVEAHHLDAAAQQLQAEAAAVTPYPAPLSLSEPNLPPSPALANVLPDTAAEADFPGLQASQEQVPRSLAVSMVGTLDTVLAPHGGLQGQRSPSSSRLEDHLRQLAGPHGDDSMGVARLPTPEQVRISLSDLGPLHHESMGPVITLQPSVSLPLPSQTLGSPHL